MKTIFSLSFLLLMLVLETARASLSVKVDDPKPAEGKALVKITMVNTFSNKVESARATLFLLDEKGKAVAQKAEWVIGGTKERRPLEPNGTAIYYFNVPTNKPFKKARVIFTRIILENGQVVQAGKGFELKE
jgi:hypothetical protein